MKKFVSGMLAAAMALSLAACSSSGTLSAADSGSSSAAESGSTTESTGTPIHLGGIGPLTGDNAAYGIAVRNGAQLAVDEINAAAGSEVFTLSFQDDESDSEKAVNAFNTLLDEGMQILVGPVTSNPSISVAAECLNENIFMLTPSASAQDVVETGAGVTFQMCFTDPNQGVTAADYIADNALGTAIGIIYDSSDAYSTGIYTAFETEAQARGLNIVQASSFTADSNTDLSTQVQQCKDAGADLVFLPIYYQQASVVLSTAAANDYAPVFFGCDGMDGILGIDGFDTSLANGLMLLCPFSAYGEDETTTTFVSAYEGAFGETPNQFAADAYDCVYAIYQCVTDGTITPDMSASDMCDALKTAFTSMSFSGTTGENQTWSADGTISKEPKVYQVQDGSYVLVSSEE
ncbi:MAG TPA: penicillin-binding protein activator [Candidatus Gemmiger faecigallinarum]|nr:penicillin-binding protein activator [Candidatus Gemmiger faecigallinarum]